MQGLMTEEQILEIAEKETCRIQNPEDRADAIQEFCLGILEAQSKAIEGKGVRAYSWKTARGRVKTFLKKSSVYNYHNRKSIDIHSSVGNADGDAMIDLIPSNVKTPVAAFVAVDEQKYVRDKVDDLPREMRKVIKGRFFEGKTLEAIGKSMKLTRERIRQIERDALEHLRFQF